MSKTNKILYPSRIEENNLGDILINALLVRELSKHNIVYFKGKPNHQLLSLITENNKHSANVKVIAAINTQQPFLITKLQTLSYLIKKSKFHMVFDTPGHISSQKSLIKNILKSFFETSKIITYKLLGVKYVKYGITLGPFSNVFWKFQKIIARLSYLIVVRDQKNADLLVKKKLKNTMLKPDLAFLLANNKELINYNKEKPNSQNNGVVTVSLRGSIVGKSLDKTYFKKITDNTIALIYKLQESSDISKINISYQVDADKKTSFLLEKSLQNEFKNIEVVLHKEILNFQKASQLYQASNMVITNRLHVFLFAMACNTKSYIVTDVINHKKLISIATDLKMDSLIYNSNTTVNWETKIVDTFLITANSFSKELKEHIATL